MGAGRAGSECGQPAALTRSRTGTYDLSATARRPCRPRDAPAEGEGPDTGDGGGHDSQRDTPRSDDVPRWRRHRHRQQVPAGRPTDRVLVDAGLYQGLAVHRRRNWDPFPVDPATIGARPPHACAPRPHRLPPPARPGRVRRTGAVHPGDRGPGSHRAPGQRTPAGGGRRARRRRRVLQALARLFRSTTTRTSSARSACSPR